MRKESFLVRLGYFLRTVILIEVLVVAGVAVLSWVLGWRTPSQYGEGLIWASLLLMLVGASTVITNLGMDRSFSQQYAQSAGAQRIADNIAQAMKEGKEGQAFFFLMLIVGIIAFLLGALIQAAFG